MKKARLAFCLTIALAVLLPSCSGLSPFIRNGSSALLARAGSSGDIVAYVNIAKAQNVIKGMAGGQEELQKRIRDTIVVFSGDAVYGAVEGDIPYFARQIIAERLNASLERMGDLEFYAVLDGEEDVFFDLVCPGVILFSSTREGFVKAFDIFIKNENDTIINSVSLLLQSAGIGIYARSPKAAVSELFSGGKVESLLLLIDDAEGELDECVVSGFMKMEGEDSFRVANALMADALVQDAKTNGRRIDMGRIFRSYKASAEQGCLGYQDLPLPASLILRNVSGR